MSQQDQPSRNARRSSDSPKADSFVSRGTYHTESHLMTKQEFEEVELHNNDVAKLEAQSGIVDYTTDPKFKFCFLGLCIYIFLFALDQFIITSAVPQLLSTFEEGEKLAWLNSAFFISCCGFICWFSQLMTIIRPKLVYLGCCLIFLAGCAICGAASSMNMLIVGRAVAGLGGAGLWAASYIIAGQIIPLVKRPALFGLYGLVYLLASVGGPVIGGAFADMGEHGWRWCFYISIPIGGAMLPLLMWTMPRGFAMVPFDGKIDHRSKLQRIIRMDWIGALLCVGWVTCFAISLQWGGVTKEWNDPPVIALLVLAPVLLVMFIGWSLWLGPRAMLPTPLFRSRHLWGGVLVSFFGYGVVVIALYYLSIYFQAVKGHSATKSGLLLLGLQLAMCPTIVIVSKVAERKGHLWPSIPVGGALAAIACGLFFTLSPSTSTAKIIGYQIIAGVGVGAVLNIMIVIVQADYAARPGLEPHATAVQNWFVFIGRIVGITVATNLFENKLKLGLEHTGYLSDRLVDSILSSPRAVRTLPAEMVGPVIDLYSDALNKVWIVSIALACACFFSSFLLKRLNMLEIHNSTQTEIALSTIEQGTPPRIESKSS